MSDFEKDKLAERLQKLEIHIELLHEQVVTTRMRETFLVNFLEQRGVIQEGEFAVYMNRIAQDLSEYGLVSVAKGLVHENDELGNSNVVGFPPR